MACNRGNLTDYLGNFTGQDPLKAAYCPFVQDQGAGLGMPVFALFFFGFIGIGLSLRTQHPGPVIIAGMLSAGVVALSVPGIASKMLALAIFVFIAAAGLYLYQRAQSSL